MDSLSPDSGCLGDLKSVDLACKEHGTQVENIVRLTTGWSEPSCSLCKQERDEAAARQVEIRREKESRERKESLIRSSLNRAAIPPRFVSRSFDDYEAKDIGSRTALETCRAYAESFPRNLQAGSSVILCGNAGTGKTHLACSIARYVIIAHERSAVYMTVGKAFRMVKETYRRDSDKTEEEALAFFSAPDLLILDEIGVQYGSDTEKNILFEIVNERYEALRPTILISNLALPSLTEYAGERVIDRMKENGGKLVVFDWKSRRGAA